jgi:hypothetical protein
MILLITKIGLRKLLIFVNLLKIKLFIGIKKPQITVAIGV